MYKTILLVLGLLIITGCSKAHYPQETLDAQILSVNDQILSGNLYGALLRSSSGTISDDVIKVGVKFYIGGELYLEDIELNHAELTYFNNRKTLPLTLQITSGSHCAAVYLNNRKVKDLCLPKYLYESIRAKGTFK
jgi:hypothetical protein